MSAAMFLLIILSLLGFVFFMCCVDYPPKTKDRSPQQRREYVEKLGFFLGRDNMLAKMYAEECRDQGLSKFDARNMVEHYLEWEVKAKSRNESFGAPHERAGISENYREDMAERAVDLVYDVPRTEENTKPHITVRADIG